MIRVSGNVRLTSGGMYRAIVSAVVGGVERSRDGARAHWKIVDAWKETHALVQEVREGLGHLGYAVAP